MARLRALPGGAGSRQGAAVRWIAPAVFLLAVTGIVLVVRSGLRTDASAPTATTTAAVVRQKPATQHAPAPQVPKQWYVIQSGDTLDAIAAHFGTTTAALLALNPGVQPTALHPGERVRVK